MLESIYVWLVTTVNENFPVFLGLMLLLIFLPGIIAVRFKYPDDKSQLPIEITKMAIKIFFGSLPLGLVSGIIALASSESVSDLTLIPICTLGVPIIEVIFIPIAILRMSKRHYKNEN